jgi:BMFP domain-containing protein YqiC
MREWMGGMDFVSRDEFEAVKAMAAKAREENEELKARVAALEAKLGGETKPKAAPKRKPGVKS